MSGIETIPLRCGATLVAEPMASVASVALTCLLPVGSAGDPSDGQGYATLLSELIFRGAGGLTSRQHSDALDRCGVQRDVHVQTHHLRLGATMLGDRMDEALPLLTAMVRAPALPVDAMEAVRSLCLQSLDGLDDEPQQTVMLRLRERHLPSPFNRHGYGDRRVLAETGLDPLAADWARRCRPESTIFAAAGAVDPPRLAAALDRLLGDWSGPATAPARESDPPRGSVDLEQETAQVHLAVAYDAPREADEHSVIERLAVHVLSGSTSGRLFTEVRQKRSLCYSVGAGYRAGRDTGYVGLYAGTTPQRASETLDVCLAEIDRMTAGVSEEEFRRAVVGLKSSLVMRGESTPARAGALAADQFCRGRARTLDDVARSIDAVSIEMLNDYLESRDFGEMTVVRLGPVALEAASER